MARWCILLLLLAGCGGEAPSEPAPKAPPGIHLTSAAFDAGAPIPRRYTCAGDDTSPPLAWTDVPAGAKSLALIVEDPDAPGGTYVHWTVFGIPPTARGVQAGDIPAGALEGENSFGKTGYGGPCPPGGDRAHHYVFSLYALRGEPDLEAGAEPDAVLHAVRGALARGQIIGTFKRG